ncbi:hypothetical protein O988_09326 [Pseudogymnoascus sp. VKM F-3808]|nr:hypothetical protein O988_09326 [Pseudogymnoascus sp. VKM F-3808]
MDHHTLMRAHTHPSHHQHYAPTQQYTPLPVSYTSTSYLDIHASLPHHHQQEHQQQQQGVYDFPFSQQQQGQANYIPRRQQAYQMPTSAPQQQGGYVQHHQQQQQTQQLPRSYPSLNAQSTYGKPAAIAPAVSAGWGQKQMLGGYEQTQPQQQEQEVQEVAQSTDVDALMRAIQAKPTQAGEGSSIDHGSVEKRARGGARDISAERESGRAGAGAAAGNGGEDPKKRAHTGAKPYTCTYPTCHHAFSQLGNLKTHLRRHTGERPFACPTCGKTFAQRGNVRAHAAVHDAGGAAKKFVCRLDGCGKCFTQLGNLKSHMNKFHVETLRGLTARFAESERGEGGGEEEDELLEYFRSLYRNANKGIKGRGKGRKVAATGTGPNTNANSPPSLSSSTSSLSSLASLPLSPPSSTTSSYTAGIPAHLNMGFGSGLVAGMGAGMMGGMDAGMGVEMFDGSSSGIGSPCASSLGSLYEVGTYEEEEGGELAFGDRMY